MPSCPSCQRPIASARACCLYCGAPFPVPLVAQAGSTPVEPAPAPSGDAIGRTLVVVELDGCAADALVGLVADSRYEGELLARRGGLHLHRILPEQRAERESERLRSAGIATVLVPEAEARVPPLRAVGGERTQGGAGFRTEEGPCLISAGALLLVVEGSIARQRQASLQRRRLASAALDEGWRVHLHRLFEPRPIEIDSEDFEPGFAPAGSTRLELAGWLSEIAPGVPRDDGFRRLSPALAPSERARGGRLSAAAALGAGATAHATAAPADQPSAPPRLPSGQLLDNLAQFRFYSGWRAAVERRRRAAGAGGGPD